MANEPGKKQSWMDQVKVIMAVKLSMWIGGVLLLGAAGAIWGFILVQGTTYHSLPGRVTLVEDIIEKSKLSDISERLRAFEAKLDSLEKMIQQDRLVIEGLVEVGDFGDADLYGQVNILSPKATPYRRLLAVGITNLDDLQTPSLTIRLRGTYRSTEDRILIKISRRSARELGIRAARARVLLQPVEDWELY